MDSISTAHRKHTAHGSPQVVVPAITRAAQVLEALDEAGKSLTFAQLVARVDMPRSSIHNVCTSLMAVGLLERDEDGRFQIGLRVVELARSRLRSIDLISSFQYVLRAAPPSRETIVLSVLRGSDVTYVSIVHGDHPVAVRYEIGMRLPAAYTASGKAILSALSDERVRQLIGAVASNDKVVAPPKPVGTLLTELAETRLRRFSVDDEETALGMICVGAPVRAGDNAEPIGALAISTVKAGSTLENLGARVIKLASKISAHLGAVSQSSSS